MSEKQYNLRHTLARVFKHFRRHKFYISWGLVVTILSNTILMASPWIVKLAIDGLKQNRATMSDLQRYALLIIIIALSAGFFRFMMRRTLIWASRIFEYEFRNEFFRHLLGLPRSFYQETPTGDIIARGSNDIEAVRLLVGPAVMQIGNSVVSIAVALTLMFILSWKLTLIALAAVPILALMTNKLVMQIHKKFFAIQEHFSRMSSFVQENLSGIKVVKAYNQENPQIGDFSKLNKTYIDLNLSLAKTRGLFLPLIFLVVGLITLTLLYFGGRQVIDGAITLGTLVAFIQYLMRLTWPMLAIGWTVSLFQRGTASLERINKILDRESEIVDKPEGQTPPRFKGEIEIRDLNFSYPNDDRLILKDINLTIPAGTSLALVGPTGCGKSTLVNLLVRTFRLPEGKIFIDGHDINKIELKKLRTQIGYVPQEAFLFSQRLSDNIAFGLEKSPPDEVRKASEIAGIAEEFEEFPDGFETMIGERGVTLSGGQKQRTALARAIIKKPPILILDDAFASVDTSTEDRILNSLSDVIQSRTSIIIAHRISTIKNADKICVMDQGRIIACGTHDELTEKSPEYARIVELQSLKQQLEEI